MYELPMTLFQRLEGTSIATSVRESNWLFPTLETVHVIAIVLVVGTIWIADLRMMGLASTKARIGEVLTGVLPATWISFAVAFVSGCLMFASSATIYADNTAFRIKIVLLMFAGTNMVLFHWYTRRGLHHWDHVQSPPAAMRIAGAASFVFWTAVIFAGRWIGF